MHQVAGSRNTDAKIIICVEDVMITISQIVSDSEANLLLRPAQLTLSKNMTDYREKEEILEVSNKLRRIIIAETIRCVLQHTNNHS